MGLVSFVADPSLFSKNKSSEKVLKKMKIAPALLSLAASEVLWKEDFSADGWESRWVQSSHKDDYGKLTFPAANGTKSRDSRPARTPSSTRSQLTTRHSRTRTRPSSFNLQFSTSRKLTAEVDTSSFSLPR